MAEEKKIKIASGGSALAPVLEALGMGDFAIADFRLKYDLESDTLEYAIRGFVNEGQAERLKAMPPRDEVA